MDIPLFSLQFHLLYQVSYFNFIAINSIFFIFYFLIFTLVIKMPKEHHQEPRIIFAYNVTIFRIPKHARFLVSCRFCHPYPLKMEQYIFRLIPTVFVFVWNFNVLSALGQNVVVGGGGLVWGPIGRRVGQNAWRKPAAITFDFKINCAP